MTFQAVPANFQNSTGFALHSNHDAQFTQILNGMQLSKANLAGNSTSSKGQCTEGQGKNGKCSSGNSDAGQQAISSQSTSRNGEPKFAAFEIAKENDKKSSDDIPDVEDIMEKLEELAELFGIEEDEGSGGTEPVDPGGAEGGARGGSESGGPSSSPDPDRPLQAENLGGRVKFFADNGVDAQQLAENFNGLYSSDKEFRAAADQVVEQYGTLNITAKDLESGVGGIANVRGNNIAMDLNSLSNGTILAHELLHNIGWEHGAEMDAATATASDMA